MCLSRFRTLDQIRARLILTAVLLFCGPAFGEIEVQLAKGKLRGQILKSRNGRPYYSYTGIPYAKPPVGELRFEAPEPVDSWNGTLDATKSPNVCLQSEAADGVEDCLYLNVFTPRVDGDFPVMFWIYGGAFRLGDSTPDTFGPEYLMDKDVVLVSVHFRLGVLGLLSAEDDVIPGNYMMKDQVFALRWVRENVEKFGGDAGSVTMFGGSSGGASVGYHLLSPMSKGLFHRAVLQSGSPLNLWSTYVPGVARNLSKSVFELAGCTGKTSGDSLKCLKKLPASFFNRVREKLLDWRMYPVVLFSPVVERCDSGRESFLCHHQLHEFKQESFVPTIMGLNSADGGIEVTYLYNDTSAQFPELHADFNRLISIIMPYQHFTLDVDKVGQSIFRKYFPSGKIEDHSHLQFTEMITDGGFMHGMLNMAFKLSSPVYFYLYDYRNEFSFNTLFGKCNKDLGVAHGDELSSLFKLTNFNPKKLNARDTAVSETMVNIWTTFASAKIPTIDGTENGPVWPTFDEQNQSILYIDSDQPKVIRNPYEKTYAFWNSLPLLSNLNKLMSKIVPPSNAIKNEL